MNGLIIKVLSISIAVVTVVYLIIYKGNTMITKIFSVCIIAAMVIYWIVYERNTRKRKKQELQRDDYLFAKENDLPLQINWNEINDFLSDSGYGVNMPMENWYNDEIPPNGSHKPKHLYCPYERYEPHTYVHEYLLHPRNIYSRHDGHACLSPNNVSLPIWLHGQIQHRIIPRLLSNNHIFPCMVIFNHFIVESCWRLSHSSLVRFHLLCVHSQYCGAFLIICSNCSMNIAVISYSVQFTSGISIRLNVHS